MDIAGSDLNNATALAASLGKISVGVIKQLLGHWKHYVTGQACVLLEKFCNSVPVPNADDPFTTLGVRPRFGKCPAYFLEENSSSLLNLQEVEGKTDGDVSKQKQAS